MPCTVREELYAKAQDVLLQIRDKTQVQLDALVNRDYAKLMAADKELELLIGRKERAFGALRQHTQEHGC